jgi:glutamate synthase domain-containing protein 2/glutamate synthase domain-containing protein 1/glutamate synthase domain-containing protein 3
LPGSAANHYPFGARNAQTRPNFLIVNRPYAQRGQALSTRRPNGLYDPANEHDACGVACLARLDGVPRHDVVERALETLDRLEHRGAEGADPNTGDGAGILLQVQREFLVARAADFGLDAERIPAAGEVALGMCFLPPDEAARTEAETLIERELERDGHAVLGWRDVPIDPSACGEIAREAMPRIRQVLIGRAASCPDQDAFERRLYVVRRRIERAREDVYFPSFSSRTVVYKGMLTAPQLRRFYTDLRDPALTSALAVVHSRFSTNTFPSWELAHPHRMVAHNGEINTLAGNINWMQAREAILASELFGEDLRDCLPLVEPGMSDSAAFDRVFELLALGGRSLPHTAMMMVPRAWEGRTDLPPELVAFYRYHSRLIEAWDGPAAIVYTDGRVLGATLDRNGLRPGRWVVTRDGWVALSSETGSFEVPDELVERRGRLHPGAMFVVDLERGRVLEEGEAELEVARLEPWGEWDDARTIHISALTAPTNGVPKVAGEEDLRPRQLAFGYSQEDLRIVLLPMARDGKEPTGSMGADVALAMLSERAPSLFAYFKQRFAQVTNPAIDPVREQVVMSLRTSVGPEANLFVDPDTEPQLELEGPVLTNEQMATLRGLDSDGLRAAVIDITWPLADGAAGLEPALERICAEASEAIAAGRNLLVLSDRAVGPERVPIPVLLASSAVHHHLVRTGERVRAGLVVESGEPREVHHVAALIGFGASAVNPYTMLDTVADLAARGEAGQGIDPELAQEHTVEALRLGLLKVLSKMGISTIKSYTGAKIFEAVGLSREVVDRWFPNTQSSIDGVGLDVLAREALERHARAWPAEHGLSVRADVERNLLPADHERILPQGGVYQWRRDGERHMWDPETIAGLQRAARNGDGRAHYSVFAHRVNEENARHGLVRGLLRTRPLGPAVPVDEVEPASEILKRFATGAMSLGALSPEAHETLAIAMNRLGGRSNSGEGGEDPRRYRREPNGDWRRSAIKQVASGRFGVTAHYLANADQIQIKIAQGAKPGEGGQLPGHKVDEYIAQLRHSTPGVELISPPPHHDIYSIEDLKQLIYDLRTSNPAASISVKLASELGVGTVAAGVVKAGADHVVIAGHDGGTGASPQSSIHSAGVPWEIGLAETQHTLIENDLRTRVQLQIDGQMRTGRDVLIAALMGADEYGFSTAPLIATGCIMMRVCHLNTCPVGVATQDPELRRRFSGKPEHVVNYLVLVAEEVRALLASLGARSLEEVIGRADLLETEHAIEHWKAGGVDLSPLLAVPDAEPERRRFVPADVPEREDLDPLGLLEEAREAIASGTPITLRREIKNPHRAVGGVLAHEVTAKHGPAGLPDETIRLELHGSAGQSLGAWLAPGISIDLEGDANDYVGKGLSGGILTVRPPAAARFVAEENVIAGNVVLYGATGGRAFFRGRVGERFAIRNSGAKAVVEGVGDHGCEYMTGGVVVVLGPTGHNFAAGMTGGVAYVWDPEGKFPGRCNRQLVDLDPLDEEDRAELRGLLVEHHARTDSAVAERILESGEAALEQFVKVMPREYKRIISERRQVGTVGAQA